MDLCSTLIQVTQFAFFFFGVVSHSLLKCSDNSLEIQIFHVDFLNLC